MSLPRRLLPGQTHSITRRVSERRFLLRPGPFVNGVVRYALARASQLNPRVALHGFVAESNHTHANVTDTRTDGRRRSQLPAFFRCANRLIAAALNTRYGRGENFWVPGSFDNTEIHNERSLEQQLLYLWTNPVKDGLVDRPEAWPGVMYLPEDFGRTIRVPKPEGAFFGGRRPASGDDAQELRDDWQTELAREEGEARALLRRGSESSPRPRRDRSRLPDVIELTIQPPPGYEHLTLEEVRAHFRGLLEAELARIHAARRALGRTRFFGVEAVLRQDPLEAAGETWPSFKTNPRVACRGDTERRVAVLAGLQEWRATYRVAYEALARGVRAWFPAGTHGLARLPWVRVRDATGPPLAS